MTVDPNQEKFAKREVVWEKKKNAWTKEKAAWVVATVEKGTMTRADALATLAVEMQEMVAFKRINPRPSSAQKKKFLIALLNHESQDVMMSILEE